MSGETARERLLSAAYDLFCRHGIGAVGVDSIIAEAGVAKMSLYRHFESKEGLALAFLRRREEIWAIGWLEAETLRRADEPEDRLLAVFDVLHGWFQRPDFEGCAFMAALLESPDGSAIHRAAAGHLARNRGVLRQLAVEAGLATPETFAQTWQMLIKGAIVAAEEGHKRAARDAQKAAQALLAGWPRKSGQPG